MTILRAVDSKRMSFLTLFLTTLLIFALGSVTTIFFTVGHDPGVQGATLRALHWHLLPPQLIRFMRPYIPHNLMGGDVNNRGVFPQHKRLLQAVLKGLGEVELFDDDRLCDVCEQVRSVDCRQVFGIECKSIFDAKAIINLVSNMFNRNMELTWKVYLLMPQKMRGALRLLRMQACIGWSHPGLVRMAA
jgi:hypothetical protein